MAAPTDFLAPFTPSERYRENILELLGNYKDGRNVLKNFDGHVSVWKSDNLEIREDAENPHVPRNFLDLVKTVVEMLAREKYGIEGHPSEIRVVSSEEMINLYTSSGLPVNYAHWTHQLAVEQIKGEYQKGRQGLALEIVINTVPSTIYCMDTNSTTAQLLVISHAGPGHGSFFRHNHMFEGTRPEDIVKEMGTLERLLREARQKYGDDAVDELLDDLHALEHYAVNRTARPPKRTADDQRLRREANEAFQRETANHVIDRTAGPARRPREAFSDRPKAEPVDLGGDENILSIIIEHSVTMDDWQKDIARLYCRRQQYFHPQRLTQVMNEGWASFWHHTIMHDLRHDFPDPEGKGNDGLIKDGASIEFFISHSNVIAQPGFDSPYYGGFNPYALGFAMYNEIRRVCEAPTTEDREWFGKADWFKKYARKENSDEPGDWLGALKFAMKSFKDESFISQFLSPELMRELRMFAVKDDSSKETLQISAIHNDDGYKTLRDRLTQQYELSFALPRIEGVAMIDRTLLLRHARFSGIELESDTTEDLLRRIRRLMGAGCVILQTVGEDKKVSHTYHCDKIPDGIELSDKGKVHSVAPFKDSQSPPKRPVSAAGFRP